ncbi:PEP-CTERM sorting domain-containing protein [Alteromonas mediterranea]|uniref:PEP-CTERM sorting domain-containing protein n=1 Tax=Alteromonas mediterranea TaxID=314275 RepID=UPI000355668A|nr:PEP-CTERM sorting domain-containing protein [Alteromonas mediterranea]AGP84515.1 secreted surface metalloprotease [Alteromonas mediterranea U4]AGP88632.1 secreted surface metalloprotease [Alteromonas mediterranea U7]AGP92515.1 secreted surface metalloprotease [Alteromonas mediterranea U8]|tara:strand:- start:226 stop:930 length:705 start_codon:yes stop_codon:yes gene_type:complete
MKNKFLKGLVSSFALAVSGFANAGLIELVDNGGFESGNFTDWSVTNLGSGGCGLNVWSVSSSGIHGCSDNNGVTVVAPINGTFAAYNTFDGPAGTLQLTQSILLPTLVDSFSLSWFQTVDMNGGGIPRTFSVDFYTGINSLIGNVSSQQFSSGAFQNWTQFNFDVTSLLSSYSGQEVKLSFRNIVPTSFTGPAGFGLDSVSLVANTVDVPEPSTIAIFTLSLLGLASRKFKNKV